jgi:DNA-directed RNA polymerase subunit RPC12/RpoP
MIKVLNKKVEEPKVYKAICDECRAELEYEYEDTYEGYAGMRHIKCPECGYEIMSEYFDGIELDENNVKYPKHFYLMSENAKDISNEEIQTWVRRCLSRLRVCENGDYTFSGSGNTIVFAFKSEEEYTVYVAKNYAELSITRI